MLHNRKERLSPTLTPMVHMQNPVDVAAAIVAARNAEIGFNYAATTTAMPTLPSNSMSTIPSLITPSIQSKPVESDIDKLTKQMEQLSLNYAQISAALIAQTKPIRRNNFNNRSTQYNTQHNSQSNNQYDNQKHLQCYGCGQLGHIKRNCPKI